MSSYNQHNPFAVKSEEKFPNISEKEFCEQEARWWLKDADQHYQEFLYSIRRAGAWQVQADTCK